MKKFLLATCAALLASHASATVLFTEWMYSGNFAEFYEITNLSGAPIDLTGWSYDDDSRTAGSEVLSSLGTLGPWQSAILTEAPAAAFAAEWKLPASIKIRGDITNNIGRTDELNLYNAAGTLVDRLTYSDQAIAGSIRTQNVSGIPSSIAALGANNVLGWQFSAKGDAFGSYVATSGDIGNPGRFSLVPEPTAAVLLAAGVLVAFRCRR